MWWLFVDPEDAGAILISLLLLAIVGTIIFFSVRACNPDAFKQTNNIIPPNTKIIEKPKQTVAYDTILINDSTLILRKK